ncbi:hypothetical protein sos41_10000 [Alphaproteobacteria bacterium SO-S41]|nr:hypothetical protein sos41_10000 [Alphaproteobacteria bacterium SO-S41]
MRGFVKLGAAIAAALLMSGAPFAQSPMPPPFGYWEGDGGGQALNWSSGDGSCAFAANGTVTTGICDWQPSYAGGILVLTYQWVAGPAAMRFSVIWQDENTITISGHVFHRRS